MDAPAPAPVAASLQPPCGDKADPPDPVALRYRLDGWTPARQREFLEALAETGSVTSAAARVGLSRESAHRLKRRPEALVFARTWDAAVIHARSLASSELVERGLSGWRESVWYHGKEVGARERFSPQLLLATLARLDRQADGIDYRGHPARVAATQFDELLDRIGSGEDAADLIAEQDRAAIHGLPCPDPEPSPPSRFPGESWLADGEDEDEEGWDDEDEEGWDDEDEEEWDEEEWDEEDADENEKDEMEAGLEEFEAAREMLDLQEAAPETIDVSALDPAKRDEWSELDWERAYRTGLLDRIEPADDDRAGEAPDGEAAGGDEPAPPASPPSSPPASPRRAARARLLAGTAFPAPGLSGPGGVTCVNFREETLSLGARSVR